MLQGVMVPTHELTVVLTQEQPCFDAHVVGVLSDPQGVGVPVHGVVLQLQPYSEVQAVCVAFALQGVTVPLHELLVDQEQATLLLHAVEFAKLAQGVATPEQVAVLVFQAHPAAVQ